MDWIYVTQGTEKWRAVVNTAMNLLAPKNAGNRVTSWGVVSFQEGIGCTELVMSIEIAPETPSGQRGYALRTTAVGEALCVQCQDLDAS